MDSTALIAGIIGAAVGSLTSIGTLVVQNVFQNRRESKRLMFETAFKDYELRFLHATEQTPQRASFPIVLAYHRKMMALIEGDRLTPAAAREILDAQVQMGEALRDAVDAMAGRADQREQDGV